MFKTFLFFCFTLTLFAQDISYDSLSDQQLQEILKKELYDMEARNATPQLIYEKFVVESSLYQQSREAYFRSFVYTDYVLNKMVSLKMEEGTDAPSDLDLIQKLKTLRKERSYQDYLAHKKTDEAKEQWENSTQDGVLKLVVDNHEHYTEAEQKRYDGLIILLDRDRYFTHLDITDGKTTRQVMPNSN